MASLDDIRNFRKEKLAALREQGKDPYPVSTERQFSLFEVQESWEELQKKGAVVLAGRITALRGQGGVLFFDFFDGTATLQGLLKKGEMSEEDFSLFEEVVDVGDFLEVTGALFLTKREERTILVSNWKMLSKSLRPLPEKWHGLQDSEEKLRRRYLDILSSQESRERFLIRSRIVSELRKILEKEGFLEVETPILQPLAGGASAKPFSTHHNALDVDLYLRIAPELYLKELLVGGFEKVYEIGRNFRNEGIDITHNPEFTTVEWYESYSDATKQREFVERVIKSIARAVTGKKEIEFEGEKIDFSKKFAVESYADLLKRYALLPDIHSITREEAELAAKRFGIEIEAGEPMYKILDNIYKRACRPKLLQPTVIVDYPVEALPLAKRKKDDPRLVDAFQVVIGGIELVKAFSELNDPLDQRERFAEQEKNKRAGDDEAQPKDEEYLEAMEYGMPPAAGLGMSIDRLTMLFSGSRNIRDVILFPTLRPRG